MKSQTACLTLFLAPLLANTLALPAGAESQRRNEVERVSTFSAAVVAGAVAGGPLGMIAGALGGAYLAEKNRLDFVRKAELSAALEASENELSVALSKSENLAQRLASRLEFQVMFATGDDQLTDGDRQRIQALAEYLKKNPQLKVRLDGHADPRGTEEYNNVLSAERARSVAEALTALGVDGERILQYYHGASLASSIEANRDHYAFERRVHIEVFADQDKDVAFNP